MTSSRPEPGVLQRIWIKRRQRGPMEERPRIQVRRGEGLAGNADRGGERQVTLVHADRWREQTASLGDIDPVLRRANLLVQGVDLERSLGRILRIGPCRLRILGETEPCRRMDQAWPGLQKVLRPRWGGGAFAEALDDGEIAVGDPVLWDDPS